MAKIAGKRNLCAAIPLTKPSGASSGICLIFTKSCRRYRFAPAAFRCVPLCAKREWGPASCPSVLSANIGPAASANMLLARRARHFQCVNHRLLQGAYLPPVHRHSSIEPKRTPDWWCGVASGYTSSMGCRKAFVGMPDRGESACGPASPENICLIRTGRTHRP